MLISHKKASNLKFKYTREPFVISGPDALPQIRDMLSRTNLPKDIVVQYDPLHLISQRRIANRFPPYEHKADNALVSLANLDLIKTQLENLDLMKTQLENCLR